MGQPLIIINAFFVIGTLLTYYFNLNVLYLNLFLFMASILIIIFKKDRAYLLLVLLSLIVSINYSSHIKDRYKYIEEINQMDILEIRVSGKLGEKEDYTSYKGKVLGLDGFYIRLNLVGEKNFKLGDVILVRGQVKQLRANGNPKLYNEKRTNLSSKIYGRMTIEDGDIISTQNTSKIYEKLKLKFEDYVLDTYKGNLNERNSGLMEAIILGRSYSLEEVSLENYRYLGLGHVLAISGLHIGIVYLFLEMALKIFQVKKDKRIVIQLLIIWSYGYLVNFPPSIIRANIILTVSLIGFLFEEPVDPINIIFLSMGISLLINPFYIFSLSFQLSYLAYFSLVYIYRRLASVSFLRNSLFNKTLPIIGVILGTLPIQAYYFNRFNLLTILANLVIGPLIYLIVNLGLLGLIPVLTKVTLGSLDIILNLENRLIVNLAGLKAFNINLRSPDILELILYYIILFILLNYSKINYRIKNRSLKLFLSGYFVFAVFFNINYEDPNMYIDFIDVGQGDSILIKYKNENYLIDTGGSGFGNYSIPNNITIPYLEKEGVKNINGFFISHFDFDHSEGLVEILKKFNVENLYLAYDKNLATGNINILRRGDILDLNDDIELEVLNPLKIVEFENNNSLVFLMKFKGKSILFTGDMEIEVENEIRDYLSTDKIHIYKSPHHGSKSSSNKAFLDGLEIIYGIISVGRDNSYGHPSDEVIESYKDKGMEVYRTDVHGRVRFVIGDEILVEPYLGGRNYCYYWKEILYVLWIYLFIFLMVYQYKILEEDSIGL